MSIGNILFNLPKQVKKTVRNIETIQRKLVKAQNALVFNQTAIKEDLLPNYTNIKTHDPATKQKAFTKEYKKSLVLEQIEQKQKIVEELNEKLSKLQKDFDESNLNARTKEELLQHFELSARNCDHAAKVKTRKKLSKLYGGQVYIPEAKEGYINLSSVQLTKIQKELLNLGLNCHYQCKYDPLDKKAELEVLYQDVLKLQKEKKVEIHHTLKDRLVGESSKVRGRCKSKLISRALFKAAKELRDDDRIVIRKADKSSVYVILDKENYLEKLNSILHDDTKFEKIKKDPTDALKAKVNRLISAANAVIGGTHFTKIVGEYAPGYAYGNVKTHKPNDPLRPIISQIPTPTYRLAKRLNDLLQQYLPNGHSLRSVDEFIDILRTRQPNGILASIDVESLFTNVPIEATIQIILDNVYQHDNLPPIQLSRNILEQLLRACTTELPFRGPDGQLYRQKEGVAMGSPLGPLFANFYMGDLEKKVLSDSNVAPNIYCRYVDDVFVDVRDTEHLQQIIALMERNSVLQFTYELNVDNKIPFLDVLVNTEGGTFATTVYRKATDIGQCLNAQSECPQRYKTSVIRSFIRRAMKYCSTWTELDMEFRRIKQLLANNGYSNTEVDAEIKRHLDRLAHDTSHTENETENNHQQSRSPHDTSNDTNNICTTTGTNINLYYRNYMSDAYKVDERVLQDIISDCVRCTNPNDRLKIQIYYKNKKTHELVMRNNTLSDGNKLKRSNVVYQFTCPHEDCRLHSASYIGSTTTTLTRRLTMHLREGSPKEHMHQHHNTLLTRTQLVDNTRIIAASDNPVRLRILESLHIREKTPAINKQIASSAVTLGLWGGGSMRV